MCIHRSRGVVIDGPIRVAAYARVSTDDEEKKSNTIWYENTVFYDYF